MIQRALLVVNRSAATGHSDATVARLQALFSDQLGPHIDLSGEVVPDHRAVAASIRRFLAASDLPALIVAAGGGGTLRAVIEGICEGRPPGQLPGPDRVRIAALRMGSGNVLARHFGAPRDPEEALRGIVASLRSDRVARCCVMRFEAGPEVHHAATLGGLGQFGRIPGNLARWHRRLPALHKWAAGALGIERLTSLEYGLALLIRSVWCALRPSAVEQVVIRIGERVETVGLLAGAVLNFPLAALPFEPGVRAEEPALSLHIVPYRGRLSALGLLLAARSALQLRIAAGQRLEIHLTDRDSVEYFLDEDPLRFYGKLVIEVAGTLAFVPGPLYDPG